MAWKDTYTPEQARIHQHVVRYQSSQPWAIALEVPQLKRAEESAKALARKTDRQLLCSYTEKTQFVQTVFRPSKRGLKRLGLNPESNLAKPPKAIPLAHDMAVLRFCYASETRRQRLFVAEAKAFWTESGWGELPEFVSSRPLVWEEASKCFYTVRFADSASPERAAATLATDAEKLKSTEAMAAVIAKDALKVVMLCFDVARSGAIRQALPKYPKLPIVVESVDYAPPAPKENDNGTT